MSAKETDPFDDFLKDDFEVLKLADPLASTVGTDTAKAKQEVNRRKPDLRDKKRIVVLKSAGNTGKSTTATHIVDLIVESGRKVAMVDLDRRRYTLSNRMPGVVKPVRAQSDDEIRSFFQRSIFGRLDKLPGDMLIDTQADEMALVEIQKMADLRPLLDATGVALVILYPLSPRVDDLAVLTAMQAVGLKPDAFAFVLGEFRVPSEQSIDAAYAQIRAHPSFVRAINAGAAVIRMPTLVPAEAIANRGISMAEAVSGEPVERNGAAVQPLSPLDRGMTTRWRQLADAALEPIDWWLPYTKPDSAK